MYNIWGLLYFLSFFFSFFAFSFFRSRFFKLDIPFLHASLYFPKNSSNPSCDTIVEIFNLPPSVARTRRGNVSFVWMSERLSTFDSEEVESVLYESTISYRRDWMLHRFWVRNTDPWSVRDLNKFDNSATNYDQSSITMTIIPHRSQVTWSSLM